MRDGAGPLEYAPCPSSPVSASAATRIVARSGAIGRGLTRARYAPRIGRRCAGLMTDPGDLLRGAEMRGVPLPRLRRASEPQSPSCWYRRRRRARSASSEIERSATTAPPVLAVTSVPKGTSRSAGTSASTLMVRRPPAGTVWTCVMGPRPVGRYCTSMVAGVVRGLARSRNVSEVASDATEDALGKAPARACSRRAGRHVPFGPVRAAVRAQYIARSATSGTSASTSIQNVVSASSASSRSTSIVARPRTGTVRVLVTVHQRSCDT